MSRLGEIAQLQLALASLYTDAPPGSVAAADISCATTLGANVPYTVDYTFSAGLVTPGAVTIGGRAASPANAVRYVGRPETGASGLSSNVPTGETHRLRVQRSVHFSVAANAVVWSAVGAALSVPGTTAALTTDAAAGSITFNANVGTGTGAVGGYLFKVPVTQGSGSAAQTLTRVLTLDATTTVRAVFAGSLRSASPGIGKAATATSPLCITGRPTSSAGLASGDVWANSNVLTIVP